jgi:16S rRNA (adenine1518-N6/adenine1519-N6)-dimethyltransferase
VTEHRAKKRLGQHFLTDPNILGVIERLADLRADDVVLEIGPGLGVLTELLADRVACVHAVEIDRTLEPRLTTALGHAANVNVTFGDALQLDVAALDPAPNKLVANLPYNVATPIVVELLVGANPLRSWCVMVQREVAERFFATPSTKAYGAVSVMVQLHAERTGFHPVARTVFRPPPNVDSALVAFSRRPGPPPGPEVRTVVQAAFAHRRKTLANALSLTGVAEREKSVAALASLGLDPAVRAEALPPETFVALTDALTRAMASP